MTVGFKAAADVVPVPWKVTLGLFAPGGTVSVLEGLGCERMGGRELGVLLGAEGAGGGEPPPFDGAGAGALPLPLPLPLPPEGGPVGAAGAPEEVAPPPGTEVTAVI